MITQNVTLSNALEVKYKEWNKILILDSAFQEPGPGPVNFVLFFFFYSNWFSEYKHPFIDKPMFVTKPDVHVPSAQLSRYPRKRAAHAQ